MNHPTLTLVKDEGAVQPSLSSRAFANQAFAGIPIQKCGALVIGGAHGSLGVVRSLGRKGIPVWLLTNDHRIAKFSRYTRVCPSWEGPNHPDAANSLLELADRHQLQGWVLFPGGDAEAQMVALNHERLSSVFRVTTPPWDVVRHACDKRLTYERAAELGVDHPWSYYPADRNDVARLDCRFPVVLKPAVRDRVNAFTNAKAWRADDRATLLARYDQAASLVGKNAVVLQELIPGNGSAQYSYAAVLEDGVPIASLVARRTRQYPIDFGYTSTFVETVELPEIEEAAGRFLRSLRYTGMVEVEFKFDARDGRYKILDVNPRTWTWHALGRISGVNFPHIVWRLSVGERVPRVRSRAGAGWMHFSKDFVAAWQEMRRGTLSLSEYLKSMRVPLEFAAFAMDDPIPGIVDLPLMLQRWWKRS